MIVEECARAKVNLTLRIRGRRADGYHELVSLVAFADDIADRVTVTIGEAPSVTSAGPFVGSIAGDNLISTTLMRLSEAEPELRQGHVLLHKDLPVAAGLGGGSADAGAVLRAVRTANPDFDASVDWVGVAASLGADVPVCLRNQPAIMSGIGERVTPVDGLAKLCCVLVNPMAVVPEDKTVQVFRRLDAPMLDLSVEEASGLEVGELSTSAGVLALMRSQGNDLEAAASEVVPDVRDVLAALRGIDGCELAAMSGAGPTCFGVFASMDDARAAAAVLSRDHAHWWVQASRVG